MKSLYLYCSFIFSTCVASSQTTKELPLYETTIPNAKLAENLEKTTFSDGFIKVSDVSLPTLTKYAPSKPNGMAVVICPGGGYAILASGHEGADIAKVFNDIGVTAFVLKYRLPSDRTMIDKSLAPLQDAQQAIRIVRKNAANWGLKSNKIGIMGFSAGGHLAASVATHFDTKIGNPSNDSTSVRPDFAILVYPVVSFEEGITHLGSRNNLIGEKPTDEQIKFFSNEWQVNPLTPPTFLIHAGDDKAVPVENSIRFYQACIKNKVPTEMHLYPNGGHGFGLNNKTTNDKWFERLSNWLQKL